MVWLPRLQHCKGTQHLCPLLSLRFAYYNLLTTFISLRFAPWLTPIVCVYVIKEGVSIECVMILIVELPEFKRQNGDMVSIVAPLQADIEPALAV